jgi:hypothetical protein
MTPNVYLNLLIDQTFDNAKIPNQKSKDAQRSVRVFCWGLAFIVLLTMGRPIFTSLIGR